MKEKAKVGGRKTKAEQRLGWVKEGRCRDCGAQANGQYRCSSCYRKRSDRVKEKRYVAKGGMVTRNVRELSDPTYRSYKLKISEETHLALEVQLKNFNRGFPRTPIYMKTISQLARGFIVHGARTKGVPEFLTEKPIPDPNPPFYFIPMPGEEPRLPPPPNQEHELRLELTKKEFSYFSAIAGERFGHRAFDLMRTILERETDTRLPLPGTPLLQNLPGGEVKLVKEWPKRRFGWAHTTNTPPSTGEGRSRGNDSRTLEDFQVDELGDCEEGECIGPRIHEVQVTLSKEELKMLDDMRADLGEVFTIKPSRPAMFREMIQIQVVSKSADFNERLDAFHLMIHRQRSEISYTRRELKAALADIEKKTEEGQLMHDLWMQKEIECLEIIDRMTVLSANALKRGIELFDNASKSVILAEAEAIEKKWADGKHDYAAIYLREFQIQALERQKLAEETERLKVNTSSPEGEN